MQLSIYKKIKSYIIPILIIVTIHILALKFTSPVFFDSNEYLSISEHIFQNHEYSVSSINKDDFPLFKGESPTRMRQPLYPLFLSVFYSNTDNSLGIVLTVQLILNIFSFILLIKIAKLVFGNELFPGSKYLLAVYFPFWMLSAAVLTESLFSFLLMCCVYLFLRAVNTNKIITFFLTGTLLGFAFLTRPIALFVILGIILAYLINYSFKKTVKQGGIILLGFLLIIAPWFIRNIIDFNDVTPLSSDGGYNFYSATLGVNEKPWSESDEFDKIVGDGYYLDRNANEKFIQKGISNFSKSPVNFFSNGIIRVLKTWSYFPGTRAFESKKIIYFLTTVLQFLILISAGIGYFISRQKSLTIFILAPIFGFTFVLLFAYSTSRFLIPVMPFVILLSSQGVNYMLNKIKGWGFRDPKSLN